MTATVATFPGVTLGESVSHMRQQPRPAALSGVGIDRLTLTFPARKVPPPQAWDEVRRDNRTGSTTFVSQHVDDQGRSVDVRVSWIAGKPWCRLDSNPARFGDPKGCTTLPFHEAPLAVEAYWAIAECVAEVVPACAIEDANVTRLDVARDYRGIASPGVFVQGLRSAKRPYAKKVGVWSDAQKGGAQTLMVGNKAGVTRLYDQFEAYAEKGAQQGWMREEIEARKGWLGRHGIKTVFDLTPARCEDLLMERHEWSRFGETVSGSVSVAQALRAMADRGELTMEAARSYLGALHMESAGVGHGFSRAQGYRYRAVLDELGVTAAMAQDQVLDVAYSARLDFVSGTEVAA